MSNQVASSNTPEDGNDSKSKLSKEQSVGHGPVHRDKLGQEDSMRELIGTSREDNTQTLDFKTMNIEQDSTLKKLG